jgi:hypothetical protein
MKGTPRTRQSMLTLAAFRPWGSSQDGRRAGSAAQSRGCRAQEHDTLSTPVSRASHQQLWLVSGAGSNVANGGFA